MPPLDPLTIIMLVLLVTMIYFMFRNNKKRKEMQQQLQESLVPGAEVMLTSGIFGRIVSLDNDTNRAVITSGDSTLEVHVQAIAQTVQQDTALAAEQEEN